jgi:peptidoglycan/xylan/chitin deacetylase (PgdA/CDA1 family)
LTRSIDEISPYFGALAMNPRLTVQSISFITFLFLALFVQMEVGVSLTPHGYISIAFDDGTQSQYDYAFPSLQAHHMNATYYVITNNTGKSSYMTLSQLKDLQGNGSEIGSHSDTHADFSRISESQMVQECQVSKQKLQSWGLVVNNFAYPFGGRSDISDAVLSQYFRSARSAYVPPYILSPPVSKFLLPGDPGEQTTADSAALDILKNYVDQVVSTNGWEIIFFHNIIPNATGPLDNAISKADFDAFLNYLDSRVTTLTVNQGLDLLSTPYSTPNVSIMPSSMQGINVGESLTFNSEVSGGRTPYTYQWYLNNNIVTSSDGFSWTFTPIQTGSYQVYLNISDSFNEVIRSNIVNTEVYNCYSLSMATNFGTTHPSSGGYDIGSTLSISSTSPTAGPGEKYI